MFPRRYRRKTFYLILLLMSIFVLFFIIYSSRSLAYKILEYNRSIRNKSKKSKIPQVVGHYVGQGKISAVSDEVINANNYNPIPGWGEMGKPVVIPGKDLFKMQQLFQINRFNLMASDGIALNRTLPDFRGVACKEKKYDENLPKASIIIVFYNEAWSTLMRTVWSVINRTPKRYLEEILLIDDGSDRNYLKEELDTYVASLPAKVRLLRMGERKGLVPARLLGAQKSNGEVLLFLDAHCECSEGWIEPLLSRVKENRRKVVSPVIDIISDDNFSYVKSAEFHWGAFNWQLHFRWYTIGDKEIEKRKLDHTVPFKTPVFAGGLFAIDRQYFYEIGSYDAEMSIWGGDNLEMSFRVWQCGGELEISPCSHVGHLFRKSSPYTFPGGVNDILDRNLIRVASVWMDEWAEFFYKFNKNAAKLRDDVDIDERVTLRRELRCHTFEWYLQNIWPEHFFPMRDRFFGRIQVADRKSSQFAKYQHLILKLANKMYYSSMSSQGKTDSFISYLNKNQPELTEILEHGDRPALCFQKPKARNELKQPLGELMLGKCSVAHDKLPEMFIFTPQSQILTDEGICLEAPLPTKDLPDPKARMTPCITKIPENNRQKWFYNIETLQIRHFTNDNYCLEVSSEAQQIFGHNYVEPDDIADQLYVYLRTCDTTNALQKFVFLPVPWM
ncbi:polypeptide N-acetylgalactosaminyltransferase 3 [Culicoides brevitarsis]|uniref:polypeptide N-acetylgalactosaminyltransferase 3 n=1 Tax=Culicoides brevitarsis TaxID=469753 RepID=UPI00307BD9B5